MEPAGAVADDHFDDRAPVARGPAMSRTDGDENERLGARSEVGDVCLVGAIDPSPRVRHQQVEDCLDSERLQGGELAFADPTQLADTVAVELAQRDTG